MPAWSSLVSRPMPSLPLACLSTPLSRPPALCKGTKRLARPPGRLPPSRGAGALIHHLSGRLFARLFGVAAIKARAPCNPAGFSKEALETPRSRLLIWLSIKEMAPQSGARCCLAFAPTGAALQKPTRREAKAAWAGPRQRANSSPGQRLSAARFGSPRGPLQGAHRAGLELNANPRNAGPDRIGPDRT